MYAAHLVTEYTESEEKGGKDAGEKTFFSISELLACGKKMKRAVT
jgi:hypothetical protein